jgi:hypothetical protein
MPWNRPVAARLLNRYYLPRLFRSNIRNPILNVWSTEPDSVTTSKPGEQQYIESHTLPCSARPAGLECGTFLIGPNVMAVSGGKDDFNSLVGSA